MERKITLFGIFAYMKKWIKLIAISLILFGAITYTYFHFDKKETKTILVSQQIDLPIDKVFPYFNNLQKFNNWTAFFNNNSASYYTPYEGKNASATLYSKDKEKQTEIHITQSKTPHTIQYQILTPDRKTPILLHVNLKPIHSKATKIQWKATFPTENILFSEDIFEDEEAFRKKIETGNIQLKSLIENKAQRESQLGKIQFDSIEIEQLSATHYIGIASSTKQQNNTWLKNLQMNHTKLENFIAIEMGLQQENYGYPTLFYIPNSKIKETSYFLGISVNKVPNITDANFSLQQKPASKAFTAYYKGDWEDRQKTINTLIMRAQKEQVHTQALQILFIEKPEANKPVLLKIILPFS